jgi:hypothetical protein
MRLLQGLCPVLLLSCLFFAPLPGRAQTVATPNNDLLLRSMAALGNHASFHTDFTFDNAMLRELARGFPGDEQSQHIVEELESVTVHVYRYPRPGLYSPADVEMVRNLYRGPAWKHLVATGMNHKSYPGHTDLWIRYGQGNVEAMTLLVAEPKALNMVEINGKLSPLDLLHLRGHFGIPRFSADRFADDNGPQPFGKK